MSFSITFSSMYIGSHTLHYLLSILLFPWIPFLLANNPPTFMSF